MTIRRFSRARAATMAPGQDTETTIRLSKLPAVLAAAECPPCPPCPPVTVDPNNGDPVVVIEAGGSYTCPECAPAAANLWPFLDTFTDPNGTLLVRHVSDSGHTWAALYEGGINVQIQDNKATDTTFYGTHFMPSVLPPGPQYDLTAVLVMPQVIPNSANQAGMMARHKPSDFGDLYGYFLEIRGHFNNTNLDFELWLLDGSGGGWTSLGIWSQTIAANESVDVVFQCRDVAKKVLVNGVERISSDNNTVTDPGRITMYLSSGLGEFRFDSFAADSP